MRHQICFTAAAAAVLATTTDARFNWGTCPEYNRMANFDTQRFMGTWYSIRKNYLNLFEIGQTCVTANYQYQDDGTVRVYNAGEWLIGPTSVMGKAVQSNVDGPGSFVVDFFQEPDPE